IDGAGRQCKRADDRTDVDDAAAARVEVLQRLLAGEEQTEHVQVKLLVKVLRSHLFERGKLVDAGIVHQDVEPAKRAFGLGKTPSDPRLPGHIRLHGDRPSPLAGNLATTPAAPTRLEL